MIKYIIILILFTTIKNSLFSVIFTDTILPYPLQISQYYATNIFTISSNKRILCTRVIETGDKHIFYYFIDVDSLNFGITDIKPYGSNVYIPSDSLYYRIINHQYEIKMPYGTSLEYKTLPNGKNIVLTSDLCPSSTNYDRLFYESLKSLQSNIKTKIPFIIFFSGKWIKFHSNELSEIKKSGLDFIAGNHTYEHQIIESGKTDTDLYSEIIKTEVILFENGILPSYFFRFPGFKEKPDNFRTLKSLNCIALNANEWMGTKSKNWGILLVHSNGVASSEVRIFSRFLVKQEIQFQTCSLVFRDIYSYFRQKFDISNSD